MDANPLEITPSIVVDGVIDSDIMDGDWGDLSPWNERLFDDDTKEMSRTTLPSATYWLASETDSRRSQLESVLASCL